VQDYRIVLTDGTVKQHPWDRTPGSRRNREYCRIRGYRRGCDRTQNVPEEALQRSEGYLAEAQRLTQHRQLGAQVSQKETFIVKRLLVKRDVPDLRPRSWTHATIPLWR